MSDAGDKDYSTVDFNACRERVFSFFFFFHSTRCLVEILKRKMGFELGLFYEFEDLVDVFPVDEVPEGFNEFGAVVIVVKIVRVLPDI